MIKVSTLIDEAFFGDRYSGPRGAIAEVGSTQYRHRFGGSSWSIADQAPLFGGPTVVFVLDLRDPLLAELRRAHLTELPLCTYTNCGVWAWPQAFQILPHDREVVLIERTRSPGDEHIPEFDSPLPEKPLRLTPMTAIDYPITEELYWQASDCFLGGKRFIRVLGPPLWMYAPARVECECGRTMDYIAALGYERALGQSEFVDSGLFLGEGAIYWFLCVDCLTLGVVSQST